MEFPRQDAKPIDAVALRDLPAAVVVADPEARIVGWNPRAEALTGWTAGQAIGTSIFDLYVPPSEARHADEIVAALCSSQPWEGEFEVRRSDGTTFPARGGAAPLLGPDGEVVALVAVAFDISDRVALEQELKRREAQLDGAQRLARMGGWEWDLRTGMVTMSDEVLEYFDLRESDFADSRYATLSQSIHPEDLPRVRAEVQAAIREGRRYSADFRVLHPSGRTMWAAAVGEPVRDDSGEVVRLRGVTQDVTARKQTEAALRDSESRFRMVMDELDAWVWVWDLEADRFLYVSPAYERLWGRSCESLHTDPNSWFEAIHPDDRKHVRRAQARVGRGERYETEYRVVRPDGSVRWVLATGSTVPSGEAGTRRLIGVVQDATSHHAARAAAAASDARLRTVTEAVNDAVISIDLDGRVAFWNAKATEIFGYAEDEVLGTRLADLVPERHREEYGAGLERVSRLGTSPLLGDEPVELRGRRKDGVEIPIEVSIGRAPDGQLTCVVRDVSARKRVEAELASAQEGRRRLLLHLVRAQEEERGLIAADVHDESLQAAIALGLRLEGLLELKLGPELRREIERAHETAVATVERLRELVFQLTPPPHQSGGLGATIRALLEEIKLPYELDDRLTGTLGPETELVLYRLAREALTNVRKHAGAASVRAELEQSESGVKMVVEDDGVGFDPAEVGSMVPRRFGVTEMRKRAELAGGTCRIEGRPEGGTRVVIWIPAALSLANGPAPDGGSA